MIRHPKAAAVALTEQLGVLALKAGSRRLVHSSFSPAVSSFKSYCVTKTSAGFSGRRGRFGLEIENTETEKSWDVRKH